MPVLSKNSENAVIRIHLYLSGFLRRNRPKSLKYQAFRRIQSSPKQPPKIAKQPLTHKTRNAVGREIPGARVQISSSPPKKSEKSRFFGLFFFAILLKIGSKPWKEQLVFGKNKAIFGILAYSNRKNQFFPSSFEISAHLLLKFTDSGSSIPLTIAFAEDSFEV